MRKPKPIEIRTTIHPMVFGIDQYILEYLPIFMERTPEADLQHFTSMACWCFNNFGQPFITRDEDYKTVIGLTCRWVQVSNMGFRFASKGDAVMAKLAVEGFRLATE